MLMLLRALIILACFLVRDAPKQRAHFYQIAFSWVGTFAPIFMVWKRNYSSLGLAGELLSIAGLALLLCACLDLGKSFGISPAIRNKVESGIYRYLKHPLYTAYILIELGFILNNPSAFNFLVAVISWISYGLRAYWEEKLINHYFGLTNTRNNEQALRYSPAIHSQ